MKSLTGATPVEAALIKAVKGDLTIYCCHTSLDNAPAGVSARMASMLGLKDVRTLDEVGPDTGSGAIGMLEAPLSPREFVAFIKEPSGFPEWGGRIFLVDIGHHESENCTKDIFHHIITEKFPNFAVRYSLKDTNPINYL